MARQLRMVLLTYTTRWETWLSVGLWLSWSLSGIAGGYGPRTMFALAIGTVFPPLYLSAMVGTHVQFQFASPRARLTPGFASAHLVAAGAILALGVALQAWLLHETGRYSCLTIASLVLTGVALGVSARFGGAMVLLFFALLIFPSANTFLFEHLVDGPPATRGAILVLALLVIAARAVRLTRLHEEMSEYSQAWRGGWTFNSRDTAQGRRRLETEEARSRLRTFWRDGQFAWFVPRFAPPSRWRRLAIRQFTEGLASILLPLLGFGLLFARVFLDKTQHDPLVTSIHCGVLFLALSMASFAAGNVWERRWPHLAHESLYPLDRQTWVRDLMCHGFAKMAIGLLAYGVVLLAVALFFQRQGPWFSFILPYLLLSPCAAVALTCVSLWASSFRQLTLGDYVAAGIAGIFWFVLSMTVDLWCRWPVALAGAVLGCLLLALFVGDSAFRRWYRVELG